MFDHPKAATFDRSGASAVDAKLLASTVLAAALLIYAFWDSLLWMVERWNSEEYSHAYLIPAVALLMVWQNWEKTVSRPPFAMWAGTGILVFGLLMFLVGELSTLYVVVQYAFLTSLAGVVLAYLGLGSLRTLWVPLIYLAFMIPLPQFLYNGLSGRLQLISSELGTALIRLFGISVFLSGNVIDLGVYKLQVAEACSGLRYLFPLMSFGFLVAYLYKGPIWQKTTLFLSTIPITVLMNSFRVAVIGVLVEYWGIRMAEGFLHQFEGWAVFLVCVAVLFSEVWILARLTGRRGPLAGYFRFELPKWRFPKLSAKESRPFPKAYMAALLLLVVAAAGSAIIGKRQEQVPDRKSFVLFPDQINDWQGRKQGLEQKYLKTLQLDDYILADYRRPAHQYAVNFYVAYYNSQRKGRSAHSPSSCIPGDGWKIVQFGPDSIALGQASGSLTVNRAVIAKGDDTQLVYYWFPERGRNLTNEYLVKWFLFWDALTRNRTDGALVRLVTPIDHGDFKSADARLTDFLKSVYPHLRDFIPE